MRAAFDRLQLLQGHLLLLEVLGQQLDDLAANRGRDGVVDGDTLWVRLASGKSERVRLIGIDAVERGACFAAPAAERARKL